MMRLGGCGAETACDSSLYFALHRGVEGIYPFDAENLSKREYVDFAHMMEKYLWPRLSGIDKLSIYIDGYSKYLSDRGVSCISMDTLDGSEPYEKAAETVKKQIDNGYPIPTLILNHKERSLKDYVWHWFLINGYDDGEGIKDSSTDGVTGSPADGTMMVKTVTYSSFQWFDLRKMWDTGYNNKGGFVLYRLENE